MRCAWICVLLAGCMVGPDYKRPDPSATPVAFKELAGWKVSRPFDSIDKGAWWSIYNDPELDRLERMVEVSNQTVKQFEAQYSSAVASVAGARADLFPVASLTAGATRGGTGAGSSRISTSTVGSTGFGSSVNQTLYSLSGTITWDLDVWGRIRRKVESSTAGAQVSAADLANAKLSAQAALATDYFNLRAEDALSDLLEETVADDRRALQITENQNIGAGTSSSIDYVTALAQLQSTQAQLVAVGVQRQQFEHAIAVLAGLAPAALTIAHAALAPEVPVSPPDLPSALLERRPDVAAAERQMQEQNALIGVQVAAYYPDLALCAWRICRLSARPAVQGEQQFWSLGASGAETLFDGGLRAANIAAARANYDASVASYRQTVLTAFQQVEDALSDLRILEQQAQAEAIAVNSARRAVTATINAYRAGTVAYTSVITEQNLLLSDRQSALAVQQSRLVASVALIQALGGGWSSADLPATIKTASPLVP